MSDGNYNRNLLPYNNYQSGVRAGEARMRTLALNAFEKILETHGLNKNKEEKQQLLTEFRSILTQNPQG